MHDSTSKVQKYTRAHTHTHTHTHSHTQINTQHSNTQINTHTHTHTYIHTLGSCELESCSRSLHSNRPMQQMPETGLCTVIRPSISSNRLPCSTRSWTSSVDTTHLLQFVEVCRWWLLSERQNVDTVPADLLQWLRSSGNNSHDIRSCSCSIRRCQNANGGLAVPETR